MASPKRPPARKKKAAIKARKCGGCGQNGHDRRNCPVQPASARRTTVSNRGQDANAVTERQPAPPFVINSVPDASSMDWDNVLYVVFDLETTGRSRQHNEIIELAAAILDPSGIQVEDAVFSQLVKPNSPIPAFITELTSITNDSVSTAEQFPAVGDAFIRFMCQHADEYSASHEQEIKHLILVGHNGKVFDIPFLVQQLSVYQLVNKMYDDKRFGLGIDTLQVAQKGIQKDRSIGVPMAYNLPTLFHK